MAQPLEFRERTEELERASLSTWATLSTDTKGRDRHEDPDPLRTVFQTDVDRIISSAAFRALAGKRAWLPVRGSPSRMQQVVLIARLTGLVARALRLNEDLAAAIAFGHALGATPFATAGEEALSVFVDGGYDPAEQALRIVEDGEGDGTGLNLTWETRDGILRHAWDGQPPATLEGQAVRAMAHVLAAGWPVTDALRSGRLRADDVPTAIRRPLVSPDSFAGIAYDVARSCVDMPEIALGRDVEEYVSELDAIARSLEEFEDASADRYRAVHCLRSLVVYEADLAGPASEPRALVQAVEAAALATEGEVLAKFRAAFEPSGEPAARLD